jgi:two-component system response regulator PilR (NtrC family)
MNTRRPVLVVDDEPDIRELLLLTLKRMQIDSAAAGNLREAREALGRQDFGLCLTDMKLGDGNGLELVRHIQQYHPRLPVAVITAFGNVENAVESLKAGAFDYVSKPVRLEDLRNLVSTALRLADAPPAAGPTSLLGESAPIQAIRALIAKVARSQAPVHLSGDSGTGKELAARLIHAQSPRATGPFVPVNCGAIPSELMESEFFGHRKGSFTGAVADKDGLFQAAAGGTLFLDEVADLPLHMQAKLLRAIQERAVRPVGSQKEVSTDVRIVSATNRNLNELVVSGAFRQDLYYRINVIEIRIPPLRERPEDIAPLAGTILERLRSADGRPQARLGPSALAALKAYAFPGNVRELENLLDRALTLCEGDIIEADDLALPETTPMPESAGFVPGAEALEAHLERIEREALVAALARTGNNKTAAAELLGMSFRAFRYKLEKYGIS